MRIDWLRQFSVTIQSAKATLGAKRQESLPCFPATEQSGSPQTEFATDHFWRKAAVEVWMLDLPSARRPGLVQTFSGRNGSTGTVVPTRVIRRRTLFAEMVASAAVVKFGRLRFMQRLQIMLNHFGSGRSRDQTCKWGIERDTCAPSREVQLLR